ncbi:MAG: HRDC domain-containing protein [Gemmatales bacterium]|nr:HRDC domain-containing protein [Gemmatales bacterium]MDW8385789.1 HRDC domain-containing protein [Gemmatales bacterium]
MLKERYISSRADFMKLCAELAGFSRLGLDTEFIGDKSFHPQLCLVQVATEEGLYLIDPLGVGPLDPFWDVIADARREIVVHAGREEARLCHRLFGRPIGRLFDLQLAAGFLGYGYPISYGDLLKSLLGVTLCKSERLTDWRRRPLTAEQVRYAYNDVRYLLTSHQQLKQRLEELGRLAWLEEEFQRLATCSEKEEASAAEKWRKLPGVASLNRRQLAIVRELYHWRQSTARRLNCPPKHLCRDDLLVHVATRNPRSEDDLKSVRGLPWEHLRHILEAVEKARTLPMEALPDAAPRKQRNQEVDLLTGVLTAVVHEISNRLQIAPQLVATNADLRSLIRECLFGETVRPTRLDAGWRKEHVRGVLVEILTGKAALRFGRDGLSGRAILDVLDCKSLKNARKVEKSEPPPANS